MSTSTTGTDRNPIIKRGETITAYGSGVTSKILQAEESVNGVFYLHIITGHKRTLVILDKSEREALAKFMAAVQ